MDKLIGRHKEQAKLQACVDDEEPLDDLFNDK